MDKIKNNTNFVSLNYENNSDNNANPQQIKNGKVNTEDVSLDSDTLKKSYNENEYNKNKGGTVNKIYVDKTFDANYYNEQLEKELNKYSSTRYKTAAAALFLATDVPKLPYFWGGGHDYNIEDFVGINASWGQYARVKYGGSEDSPVGDLKTNSLDCSGYVTWCLVNGGYDIKTCLNTQSCYTLGKKTSITDADTINNVQVGDLGYTNGHVGIVVDVNKDSKEITFAHVSGSGNGMNLTTISTETGKVTKDDLGANPDGVNRVGTEMFTTIIYVPYED